MGGIGATLALGHTWVPTAVGGCCVERGRKNAEGEKRGGGELESTANQQKQREKEKLRGTERCLKEKELG